MKTKLVIPILAILLMINLCFSAYLFKQNNDLSSELSSLNSQIYRLDIDELEKIKSKPKEFDAQEDCGTGMWQLPCE